MKTALGTVLITEDEIRRRITELGRQISRDYSSGAVTFVGILKGSFVFLADLIRAVSPDIRLEVLDGHASLHRELCVRQMW